MAFFKKFSIDFNRAALWGIHCIPAETECLVLIESYCDRSILGLISVHCVPARGVFAVLLCARWSTSGLEPEDVDGPGLLSMATSDTARIHNVSNHYFICISLQY